MNACNQIVGLSNRTTYYHWLDPAIHCTYYEQITMINKTRQNIVIPTTYIFAV